MFLIRIKGYKGTTLKQITSLNPLNQVYVFNAIKTVSNIAMHKAISLNPLNQVYVFNPTGYTNKWDFLKTGLNPLNQVYVFNNLKG